MAKKIFSNPVVITVSLAQLALAACTVKTGDTRPPNDNPPPPIQPDDAEIGPDDPALSENPPAPEQPTPAPEQPATDGPTTTTSIQQRDDGTCVEIVNIDCPEGVSCNPPPPKEVPCPKADPAGV